MRTRKRFEAVLVVFAGLALLAGSIGAAWGAYADNGDGTVTDSATGLMWQQADDGHARNWQNALSYCEALDLAGKTDWRLPDIRELRSIVDYGRFIPAINPAFGCRSSNYYWSGSTVAAYPYGACAVSFDYGDLGHGLKDGSGYVRCVRGGPSGSLGDLDITGPDGGEVLVKGQNYTITWDSQNVTGPIQIDLYKGGSAPQFMLRQLAAAAPNTGSYPFNPPGDLADGTDYLIGISAHGGTIWDFSNGFFSIVALDSDGDGVPDSDDAFPFNAAEWLDTDHDGIGNNADLDDDNDAMLDIWEALYAGLNPLLNDAMGDLDADGKSNLQEFLDGSDPNNGPSYTVDEISSLNWSDAYDLSIDSEPDSIYAYVVNCLADPEHDYDFRVDPGTCQQLYNNFGLFPIPATNVEMSPGITRPLITPYLDNVWDNKIAPYHTGKFNTVYKGMPHPDRRFEVISGVDDHPVPLYGTDNLESYFFTYDTRDDDQGLATDVLEWIGYLDQITKDYGRPIDTLSIYAHGKSGIMHMSGGIKLLP